MFVMVDVVVVYLGYILFVCCCSELGCGLWVLLGGFVNQDEWFDVVSICELCEEIGFKLLEFVLCGLIKDCQVFDYLMCLLCGCMIMYVCLFNFLIGELLCVKGSDDVDKVCWVLFNEFVQMCNVMFEDYFDIVYYFLGKL